MRYFQNSSTRNLASGFATITQEISDILPYNNVPSRSYKATGCFPSPIESFMQCMSFIERLCFSDMDKCNTFNATCYKRREVFQTHQNSYILEDSKTGMIYNFDVSTHYEENPQVKHLPVAEEQFKESPTQFLKIYTLENLLIVFTNKEIPFSSIVKLKMLQLKLAEEVIENPITEIMDFLQALIDEDSAKMNEAANKIMHLPIIQEIKMKGIDEVFKQNFTQKINDVKYDIESHEQTFIRKENELSRLVQKIRELQEEYEYIKLKAEQKQDNSELLKYLSKHPYIKDVRRHSVNEVALYYEAPLIYFDDYIAERLNLKGKDKKIVNIMLKKKYELMTRCKIIFNTQTFNIDPIRINSDSLIGHPHLDRYHCTGNHHISIHDCARTNDYIGAIEQITVAVLNLNFADGIVIETMLNGLKNQYFELPTWKNKETGEFKTTKALLEEYNNEKTQTQ